MFCLLGKSSRMIAALWCLCAALIADDGVGKVATVNGSPILARDVELELLLEGKRAPSPTDREVATNRVFDRALVGHILDEAQRQTSGRGCRESRRANPRRSPERRGGDAGRCAEAAESDGRRSPQIGPRRCDLGIVVCGLSLRKIFRRCSTLTASSTTELRSG